MRGITRFEIDPAFVANAIAEGRRLVVEVYEDRGVIFKKVALGDASPHRRKAEEMRMRKRA